MQPIIVIAAPSGSGKTTIVKRLLQELPQLSFSISAATRPPRSNERNGVDYHFISADEFQQLIDADAFLEWEKVYEGKYYGTLKSEINNIYYSGKMPILDVDVQGAVNLKKKFKEKIISIFIKPPNIHTLEERLKNRGTDAPEIIKERVAKASYELGFEKEFDHCVVNEDLEKAVEEAKAIIEPIITANIQQEQ